MKQLHIFVLAIAMVCVWMVAPLRAQALCAADGTGEVGPSVSSMSASLSSDHNTLTITTVFRRGHDCSTGSGQQANGIVQGQVYQQGLVSSAHSYTSTSGGSSTAQLTDTNTVNISSLANGTYTAWVDVTSDYGSTASAQQSFTINRLVVTPAPTVQLLVNGLDTAPPLTVLQGSTVSVSWTSTNATSCTASASPSVSGWSGAKTPVASGASNVTISTTQDFTLTCTGAGGTVSDGIHVGYYTHSQAPTATLTASPSSVVSGSNTTLTWSSTNAASCSVTQGSTSGFAISGGATSGSDASTNLTSAKTFAISCPSSISGVSPATASVTVNVSATPTYTLTVNSAGASNVSIVGGPTTYSGVTNYTKTNITSGTNLTLIAPDDPNGAGTMRFSGWSGCASVGGAGNRTCSVTMDASKTVTATYSSIVTPLSCTASVASPIPGQSVTYTGYGGAGSYTWSGSGATPGSGSGTTFTVTYGTPGAKIMTVTSGTQSATCGVNVIPICSASPSSVNTGDTVTFNGGGTASSLYDWVTTGGTPSNASQVHSVGVTYATAGTKTATLTRNSQSNSCTVTVNAVTPVGGSCTVSPTTAGTGVTVTRTAAGTGGNGTYAYSWSGSDGLTGTMAQVQKSYTTTGGKTGSVVITSNGQSTTISCANVTISTTVTPVCGSANGVAVATAPTTNLCSAGTASAVTGSGPWNWLCTGTTGTTPVSCSAPLTSVTTPLPTATLTASASTVNYGNVVSLTWSSTNATSCTVTSGASKGFAIAGSATAGSDTTSALDVNSSFAISCTGAGGTATASATVNVTPECLPAGQTVLTGQTASLSARGGTGVYAWTATGGTPASGSNTTFNTSYSTTGTKTVSLSSGGVSATACTVTVSTTPTSTGTVEIISVNSDGEPFATTWSLTGPGGTITQSLGWTGNTYSNMATGTYTFTPGSVANYTHVVTPASSQLLGANEIKTFTVTYTPTLPDGSVTLSAAPPTVDSGSAALLTWTSSGIVSGSCVASGGWRSGPKDDSGSQSTGSLTQDTTYTITCDATSGGSVTDSATVSVNTPQQDDDDSGTPQCSDGVDNDGDAFVDYNGADGVLKTEDDNDPGCLDAQDNNEVDVQQPPIDPSHPITACNDGFDNDGDGKIDQDDTGCANGDTTEQSTPGIREI